MPVIEKKIEPNLENLNQQREVTSSPEQKEDKEKKLEQYLEQTSNTEKKIETDLNNQSSISSVSSDQPQGPIADRLKSEIDGILEEGLEEIYLNMSKEQQQNFKIKGEETTAKINGLLKETKIKVRKIVEAIVDWLKLITGVNKFFIKQTAKIKTDKILAAREKILEK